MSIVLQLQANCIFKCILVLSSMFFYLLKYMVEKYFRVLLETKDSIFLNNINIVPEVLLHDSFFSGELVTVLQD